MEADSGVKMIANVGQWNFRVRVWKGFDGRQINTAKKFFPEPTLIPLMASI